MDAERAGTRDARYTVAAPTKSRNRGCGRVGLERSSGWNCPAMKKQNHTSSRRLRTGDKVDLSWAPEHTFLLDAAQDARAGTKIDDE